MKFAYNLSGGKSVMKKYGVDGGVTINAGEPVVTGEAVADNGGVTVATTIAAVGFMGCAEADATSTDAQATTGSNVQEVSVIVNPNAVWRCKFSGDAAEDADLLLLTAASAVTAGTTVTSLTDYNIAWCYEGNNIGTGFRRATAANTVVVAFPYTINAGDTFCYSPIGIGTRSQYPQLTTNLTQIDIDDGTVDSDNANFIAVDLELNDVSNEGRSNSYALLISVDHAFGPNPV